MVPVYTVNGFNSHAKWLDNCWIAKQPKRLIINGGFDEWVFQFIWQGCGVILTQKVGNHCYTSLSCCQIVCCNCWLMLIEAVSLALQHFFLCGGAHIFHHALPKPASQWDTSDTQPKTRLTKNCGSPLLLSCPSPFHRALDVWWSYPDIFYILMQNKQSQITHILPPYWFVEVVNQIKLPFLFLFFHLTCALSGSVLVRTFNSNTPEHRASFVVRLLFFPSLSLYKVFVKKNRIFSPYRLRSPHRSSAACLAVFVLVWSHKQSCLTHTVYHTRGRNLDFILEMFRFCLEYISSAVIEVHNPTSLWTTRASLWHLAWGHLLEVHSLVSLHRILTNLVSCNMRKLWSSTYASYTAFSHCL